MTMVVRVSCLAATLLVAGSLMGCSKTEAPPLPPDAADADVPDAFGSDADVPDGDTTVPDGDVIAPEVGADAPDGDVPDADADGPDADADVPDADVPDVVCPVGSTRCGEVCVDTRSDLENCGACGRACGASGFCEGGTCRPPSLTGTFVSAGVDSRVGAVELRGTVSWHATVRGTSGGVTLEGGFR